MKKNRLKSTELFFKRQLRRTLNRLLPVTPKPAPNASEIKTVLLYRLDQRLGNGILLLPLLRAIRETLPNAQIHYLIHEPVANLFQETTGDLIDQIWPYNQPALMKRPWRYLKLIRQLRNASIDVAITSHNPDNFSLSQAIFGRLLYPRYLIGFDARDSAKYYNVAIKSSTDKHYSDAMIDLWRAIDNTATCRFGGFTVADEIQQRLRNKFPVYEDGGILIWLGATGRKVLNRQQIDLIHELVEKKSKRPIYFACGPADRPLLTQHQDEIKNNTLIWEGSLLETAAFFSRFSLFLSGDTGPMHLAAALDVPTLTIFSDSNMTQYGYQDGQRHISLQWDDSESFSGAVDAALDRLMK